ncbi:condensation domain-containing protein, partial [Microbacterium terrae]|uniref:condensation domain-containing protein n=1 Tax=Microbacterium terrae TaxID=69369 RepID=UPI0005EC4C08
MRLTTVTQMTLPRGRIHSLVLAAHTTDGPALPISFDQRRHVEAGDRRGSWMAIAFRLPEQVARSEVSQAWAAVVERHGALQTVFDRDDDGRLHLRAADIEAHGWEEHDVADDVDPRAVLAGILDAACTPFAQPSHRVCLVKPGPVSTDADPRPMLVIASDHANVDMWSLLVLVRDLAECIDDLHDGRPAGSRLPRSVPAFSEHTAMLDARPPAPRRRRARAGGRRASRCAPS